MTSSVDGAHGGLVIVQRKMYVLPAIPVNVVLFRDAFANEPPVPLNIVHPPVPTAGILAANETVVNPHVPTPP